MHVVLWISNSFVGANVQWKQKKITQIEKSKELEPILFWTVFILFCFVFNDASNEIKRKKKNKQTNELWIPAESFM